jgi:putative peptide zinc metalloprotease protein
MTMKTAPHTEADDFPIAPLAPTLTIAMHAQDGKPLATLQRPDGRHFRLPLAALQLLQRIEAPGMALAFVAAQPAPARTATLALLRQAAGAGLLQSAQGAAAPAPVPARGNILLLRLFHFDPNRVLDIIAPLYRPFFSKPALVVWLLALGVTAYQCAQENVFAWPQFAAFTHFPNWILVYVLLVVSSLMHELGHAYACRRHGARVREFQLVLYFLQLGAYVNVSDAWMLPRKLQRIEIALAGLYVESYLAILTAQVLIWAEPYSYVSQAAFIFFVILLTRMALNAIPTLRLDGYWVLSDLLGEPNLRQRSTAYVIAQLPFVRRAVRLNFKPASGVIYWLFSGFSIAVIAFFVDRSLRALLKLMGGLHPLLSLAVVGVIGTMLVLSLVAYLRTIKQKYLMPKHS